MQQQTCVRLLQRLLYSMYMLLKLTEKVKEDGEKETPFLLCSWPILSRLWAINITCCGIDFLRARIACLAYSHASLVLLPCYYVSWLHVPLFFNRVQIVSSSPTTSPQPCLAYALFRRPWPSSHHNPFFSSDPNGESSKMLPPLSLLALCLVSVSPVLAAVPEQKVYWRRVMLPK